MATLNDTEKTNIRRFVENYANKNGVSIAWTKAAMNAAAQAIEGLLSGDVNIIRSEVPAGEGIGLPALTSARIDVATAPFSITFTNAVKQRIVSKVLEQKYIRDS